jgi:lipopolysaccharide/colanic/teichoic acid biosynthesis glycosyltransferase
VKRLLDIVVSLMLLLVLWPLMLIIALVIKLSSPGPALFKPTRVGLNERPYTMYKFRSMKPGGEKDWLKRFDPSKMDEFVFQTENDDRITGFGRFLRRTSLDELPNLLNVLGGSMSLVGPRPEEPEIVELYTGEMKKRLSVKPGLTGLAQVSGRGELPLKVAMAKDLEYVDKRSFWLDLKILAKTPLTVFSRRGAL